jgi:phenylacetate-CoA ligase
MARGLPFKSAQAPNKQAATTIAFQERLAASERWPAEALESFQFQKLKRLVDFAWEQIPFYRERLAGTGYRPGRDLEPSQWAGLPVLTRRDIQTQGKRLHCASLPSGHGETSTTRTSGSTNMPVETLKSTFVASFFSALTLRDMLWHRRDFAQKFVSIRRFADGIGLYPAGTPSRRWANRQTFPFPTGPGAQLSVGASISQQVEWLRREAPGYVLTYPSVVRELARHCLREGIQLSGLEQMATIGEVVSQDVREICREAFAVPLVDLYSAEEVGHIALQCPRHPVYHVQSEVIRVEILGDDGHLCGPGEVGRVVVTPLFNFAMPLLRYEIGDYAEVGAACDCGRNLPVLSQILGRTRNMMTLPNGERYWPFFGTRYFDDIAPIIQFQFIQREPDRIECKLHMPRPLTGEEEAKFRAHLLTCLPYPFRIDIVYCDGIPRSKGGKFEDFLSQVTA